MRLRSLKLFFLLTMILALPTKATESLSDREFFNLLSWGTSSEIFAAIRTGANVKAKDRTGRNTLHFHVGGSTPNAEVIKMLIDSGVDVNATDNSGDTPLMLAAQAAEPNPDAVAALLNAGAKVNVQLPLSQGGFTPLHFAAMEDTSATVIRLLVNAGANVNARMSTGATALHLVAEYNWTPSAADAIILLVNAGANINLRTQDGSTPLHWAVRFNHTPFASTALLQSGADARLRDANGKRPIDYARDNPGLRGTQTFWDLHEASFE